MRFPILALAAFIFSALATSPPHRYIIVLKTGITDADFKTHIAWVDEVHKQSRSGYAGVDHDHELTFGGKLYMYFGEFDDDTIEKIKHSEMVAYVELDAVVTTSPIENPTTSPVPTLPKSKVRRGVPFAG